MHEELQLLDRIDVSAVLSGGLPPTNPWDEQDPRMPVPSSASWRETGPEPTSGSSRRTPRWRTRSPIRAKPPEPAGQRVMTIHRHTSGAALGLLAGRDLGGLLARVRREGPRRHRDRHGL